MCRSTNRQPEPEVWFRTVYIAQESHNGGSVAAFGEQTIEIALGPKGEFENANVGTLTRRVAEDQVVYAMPRLRGNPKPAKEPRTPRVVELLCKAIEWQALLESGKVTSQAEIARHEGITRACVTQVMGMLRLVPEIQERILSLPDMPNPSQVTERAHRPIRTSTNSRDQLRKFQKILIYTFRSSAMAEGGTRTPTDFPTTPSAKALEISGNMMEPQVLIAHHRTGRSTASRGRTCREPSTPRSTSPQRSLFAT